MIKKNKFDLRDKSRIFFWISSWSKGLQILRTLFSFSWTTTTSKTNFHHHSSSHRIHWSCCTLTRQTNHYLEAIPPQINQLHTLPLQESFPRTDFPRNFYRSHIPLSHFQGYYCSTAQSNQSSSPSTLYPIRHYLSYSHFTPKYASFLTTLSTNEEPKSFAQGVNFAKWRESYQVEINALEAYNTLSLISLPLAKQPIGCN